MSLPFKDRIKTDSDGNLLYNKDTKQPIMLNYKPIDFLRLKSTKEYLDALSAKCARNTSELYYTVRGGDINNVTQGTWMHKDLAMEFARWLNTTVFDVIKLK